MHCRTNNASGNDKDYSNMADIFSKEKRSKLMSKVTGKETKPEIMVRKYLFSKGFRFRKNVKTLPGSPDIVLPKYKTVIFVHGCFWHGHDCRKGRLPETNHGFWVDKITKNTERDNRKISELTNLGWKVLVVWDCELVNKTLAEETLGKLVCNIT
jgi:DNA mismatch endonuclease (patch repair protein)